MGLWCLFAHGSRTAFRHWRVLHFWPRGLMDKASDFGSGDWAFESPRGRVFHSFCCVFLFFCLFFLFFFCFLCKEVAPLEALFFENPLAFVNPLSFSKEEAPHAALFGRGGEEALRKQKKERGPLQSNRESPPQAKKQTSPTQRRGFGPARPPTASCCRARVIPK